MFALFPQFFKYNVHEHHGHHVLLSEKRGEEFGAAVPGENHLVLLLGKLFMSKSASIIL